MDGVLLKKTRNGKWNSRQFAIEEGELVWVKSDNKTQIRVSLTTDSEGNDVQSVEIRDIKYGLKPYTFEVTVNSSKGSRVVSLAAASEQEKREWINALKVAANLPLSPETDSGLNEKAENNRISNTRPKLQMSKRAIIKGRANTGLGDEVPEKVGGLADILGLVGASSDGAELTTAEKNAQERLKEKLTGKLVIPVSNRVVCGHCDKTVYKMEEMLVDNKPFHKGCFRCEHCNRQLTLSNFAAVNKKLYCKTHYVELFKNAGGKYEVFGESGFKRGSRPPALLPDVRSVAQPTHNARASAIWTTTLGEDSAPLSPSQVKRRERASRELLNSKPGVGGGQTLEELQALEREREKILSNDNPSMEHRSCEKDGGEDSHETVEGKAFEADFVAPRREDSSNTSSMLVIQAAASSSGSSPGKKRESVTSVSSESDLKAQELVSEEKHQDSSSRSRSQSRRSIVSERRVSSSSQSSMRSRNSVSKDSKEKRVSSSASSSSRSHRSTSKDAKEGRVSSRSHRSTSEDVKARRVRSSSSRSHRSHRSTSKDVKERRTSSASRSSTRSRKSLSNERRPSAKSQPAVQETGSLLPSDHSEGILNPEAKVSDEELVSDVETKCQDMDREIDVMDSHPLPKSSQPPSPRFNRAISSSQAEDHNSTAPLEHVVMSRPRGPKKKISKKKVDRIGKVMNNVNNKNKATHERSFIFVPSDGGATLICHSSSSAEKKRWMIVIANVIELCKLEEDLVAAQKKDMMKSLQAGMILDAFKQQNEFTYSGYLEKLAMKSRKNWRKRFFVIENREIRYQVSETSRKVKNVLRVTSGCKVTDVSGNEQKAAIPDTVDISAMLPAM